MEVSLSNLYCYVHQQIVRYNGGVCYSGTSLRRTPLGPTKSSIIERVSSDQGFIIHYVGYIWDSVSVIIEG